MTLRAAYALVAQCAAGLRTLVLQPASRSGLQAMAHIRAGGLVAWSAAEIQEESLRHLGSNIPFGLADRSMDTIAWLEGARDDMLGAAEILRECERVLTRNGWIVVRVPGELAGVDEPFWCWHDALARRFPAVVAVAEMAWQGASFALCAEQERPEVEGPKIQVVETLIDSQASPNFYLLFAAVDAEHLPILSTATFIPETIGAAVESRESVEPSPAKTLPSVPDGDLLARWVDELAAQRQQMVQIQADLEARVTPAREGDALLDEVMRERDEARVALARTRDDQARREATWTANLRALARRLRRSERRADALARGEGLWQGRLSAALRLLVRRRRGADDRDDPAPVLLQALIQREAAIADLRRDVMQLKAQRARKPSAWPQRAVPSELASVDRGRELPAAANSAPSAVTPALTIPMIDEEAESLRELVTYLGLDITRSTNESDSSSHALDSLGELQDSRPREIRPLSEVVGRTEVTHPTQGLTQGFGQSSKSSAAVAKKRQA